MTAELLMETTLLLLFISMLSEMNIGKARNHRSSSRFISVLGSGTATYERTWTGGTQEITSVLREYGSGDALVCSTSAQSMHSVDGRRYCDPDKLLPGPGYQSRPVHQQRRVWYLNIPVGIEVVPERRHLHPSSDSPSRIVALPLSR
ncbi:hypothetical protein EDD85DRAFT_152278 [Armillaria nabsnona]|nr:hypothetical protein EDD85DRAFT_152278 [Armillaria nabsnona]